MFSECSLQCPFVPVGPPCPAIAPASLFISNTQYILVTMLYCTRLSPTESFFVLADLQVGQVSAMSDMDLFELLSGQSVMNLTEQDEQVLDLLIAEGGDMLHM